MKRKEISKLKKRFADFVERYQNSFNSTAGRTDTMTKAGYTPKDDDTSTWSEYSYRYHPSLYGAFTREERRVLERLGLLNQD